MKKRIADRHLDAVSLDKKRARLEIRIRREDDHIACYEGLVSVHVKERDRLHAQMERIKDLLRGREVEINYIKEAEKRMTLPDRKELLRRKYVMVSLFPEIWASPEAVTKGFVDFV